MAIPVQMADNEVSHGDILYKLGALEGKLDTVTTLLSQKQTEVAEAFRRLSDLEKRVAQGALLVGILALVSPLAWSVVAPRLHMAPAAEVHRR